jgi:poly(3-hydroxybutyrate) depolymerase
MILFLLFYTLVLPLFSQNIDYPGPTKPALVTPLDPPASLPKADLQWSAYARDFQLFLAPGKNEESLPLIIALHSCKMKASDMLEGTNAQLWQTKSSFHLMTVQQSFLWNIERCWNWFLPWNHSDSERGELARIMEGIEEGIKKQKLKVSEINVIGFSSGAAVALGLYTCFPNKIQRAGVHSSPLFASANNPIAASRILNRPELTPTDEADKAALECYKKFNPSPNRLRSLDVIHGEKDKEVSIRHLDFITEQWKTLQRDHQAGPFKEASSDEQKIKGQTYNFENWSSKHEKAGFVRWKEGEHIWSGSKNLAPHFREAGLDAWEHFLTRWGMLPSK